MRTKEEIYRQIDGLLNERNALPKEIGNDQHYRQGINAQIQVLRGNDMAQDYADPVDFEELIYDQAQLAEDWMNGQNEYDLFTDA